MKRIAFGACLCSLCTIALPAVVRAQTIAFANIADTTSTNGGIFNGVGNASVNDSGTVAFLGSLDAGGNGIYTGAGGALTSIANATVTNGGALNAFNVGVPVINDLGVVAFRATLDAGGHGIFVGSGGTTVSAIATTTSSGFGDLGGQAINNSGVVAFNSSSSNVLAGSGGALTVIANNTTNGGAISGFGNPAINDSGTVVFFASLGGGQFGIFAGTGGGTASPIATSITTTTSGGGFASFYNVAINSGGTVAFGGILDSGVFGIFTGDGGASATTVANANTTLGGIFNSFGDPSINDRGTVAFRADLDGGGFGIFSALSGAVPRKIIQSGDALFGSVATFVSMSRFGLNGSDQIAFQYNLADGRQGVALASISEPVVVPESGTLALLFPAVGVLGVAFARRRK